nr:hypothetical protein PHYPA_008152 [Physcomitrium patens]
MTFRASSSIILLMFVGLALLTQQIAAQGGCNEACTTHDDCLGRLACINGACNDDPSIDTKECSGTTCNPTGTITGPPISPSMCNSAEMSECCETGKQYKLYDCSPPITTPSTKGTLTLNGFGAGESGGGASSCTGQFYTAEDSVVALSTGWFSGGARCSKSIRIEGNGRSTIAKVVDECDTRAGCDEEHAYQPPCPYLDDVDASLAVWRALGISESDPTFGTLNITWTQLD